MPTRKHLITVAAAATLAGLPLTACSDILGGGSGTSSASDRDGYVMSDNDTIYRDENGRYYCKKPDGTTGTVVGAVAGGLLGNIIAPGGSKTLGTVIGAAGGAVAGRAVEKGRTRCR